MCGRFTLFSEFDDIIEQFNIDQFLSEDEYYPSYNVAPSQNILTIINDGSNNRLDKLRWGLIPPWAKDEKIGYKMINARAETLSEKPSFRKPLVSKRCIIPADSFYEWKRLDPKTKIPMRIKLKSSNLFAFAGLYEKWKTPEGNPLYTCTIITTKPNELMEGIHDRMPVILTHDNEKEWLNPKNTDPDYLPSLLQPYDADDMEAYQVSSLVNSPKNNSPELIESH
ncbi:MULTISPECIES: SOS response-associated peptidase [Bacillus]|uniref:Abasic site processing protein n=1 Tax=Bacillus vallismortis TaxID=72361 RepID=A0ABY4Y3R2_BACVA|nr:MULTISPECIES: SOS response-associated peptidase [Bacillus]MBL3647052.1 SOS response-associated peptidase [Bacillus sp. RHFS10]USP97248.1 SOS response-associated peptidase [Bacillus vallismortis]